MPTVEDLETAFCTAQDAAEAYSARITAQYRELYPDSTKWSGPGPDPDATVKRARAVSFQEQLRAGQLQHAAMNAALLLAAARVAARLNTPAP